MRIRKLHIVLGLAILTGAMVLVEGCKKDTPIIPTEEIGTFPINPFDAIDYGTIPLPENIDPNSLLGIHSNIFQPKCAVPGCHDGNFEPDFRTPQSSYYTLVYQAIIKNNVAEDFHFRVVPGDTSASVLHERLTNCCYVNTNDRMPQDLIGTPLPDNDINAISTWIMDGAKDISGHETTYPNLPPEIEIGYGATDALTYTENYGATLNRMDSIVFNPFYMPDSTQVLLTFLINDDSTAISALQVNTLKISLDADDYSNSLDYICTYYILPDETEFYGVIFNTDNLPKNDTLFMRYYVNDGDHIQDSEFPTTSLPLPYKTYWSFYIEQ